MSDGGGTISFESIVEDEKFLKAVNEMEKRIQGFSTAAVTEVKNISDSFELLGDQINETAEIIKAIEGTFALLNAEIQKLPQGEAQLQIMLQAEELNLAFIEQADIYQQVCERANAAEEAHVSFTAKLRELKEQMVGLQETGEGNSEAYREMQEEAVRLTGAIENVEKEVALLAKGSDGFDALNGVLGKVEVGFSVLQNSMSLLGVESKALTTIMMKLKTLMELTNGVQQVSSSLLKTMPGELSAVTTIKNLLATATNRLTVALGGSTVAAQALMATLTLGLSVAISAVIYGIEKYINSQKKAAEEAKKMGELAADACYQPIASVNSLAQSWGQLGDDMSKMKFIEDNTDKFKELGVEVNSIADAENLLVTNKGAFIESLMAKAKATAAAQLATEKYKEAMQKQMKLESMSRTTTYIVPQGGQFGGGTMSAVEVENRKYTRLEKQKDNLLAEGDKFFAMENTHMEEFYKKQQEAEVKAIGKYEEGTVGAIEEMISRKREELKKAKTNEEFEAITNAIKEEEKKLVAIKGTGKPSGPTEDAFLKMLNERKKQYDSFNKWITSGDDLVAKAAQEEFEGLLKEGDTYLQYLQNQRDGLLQKESRGSKDQEALYKLNDAIANETTRSATDAFSKELDEQLANASSLAEMLDIIAQKKNEIKEGDALASGKNEVLRNAGDHINQQIKDQTDQLINEYSSYLDKKRKMDENYQKEKELLENRLKKAISPEEQASIQAAIDNHKREYDKAGKNDGDSEYTALLQEYQNFEQKKSTLAEDFDEKRRIAREHNDQKLLEKLNKAEQEALASLSLDELGASADWSKLFSNLDELSAKEIRKLVKRIEENAVTLGIDLDAESMEAIREKLKEAEDAITGRNPFASLIKGIKEYREAVEDDESSQGLKDIFEDIAACLDMVKGAFDSVTSGLQEMGLGGDEVTQQLMGDISQLMGAASELATGIASGNPLGIIQGSIGLINSAFKIFNINDRKAERQINKHKKKVKELQEAYEELERAVDKALGEERYSSQKSAIDNLQQQQEQYAAMAEAERGKKKTDAKKVEEYENQMKENALQIEEIVNQMREDILGMSVEAAAGELGNAIIDAFAAGEDAAEAWGAKVDEIVGNVIKKMLIQKLVEMPVSQIMNKYMDTWVDSKGNFLGFDEVIGSAGKMANELKGVSKEIMEGLNELPDDIKSLMGMGASTDVTDDFDDSLTGAVKGVSEETASLVAGQMNAIRINQMEAVEMMRQQLLHLSTIAHNTSYNYHLTKLDEIADLLGRNSTAGALRSQGLN